MAEHHEPPDTHYRMWATGAMLLELHAITGAWVEFRALLDESPELATQVLAWRCPEDDWQYSAVQEAQQIASHTIARSSVNDPKTNEAQPED